MSTSPRGTGAVARVLALLLLVWGLAVVRSRPPAPRGPDAPATEFSAARARQVLQRLLGDGAPHPVGSAANAALRDRLVSELRALGLEPEVRRGLACNAWGTCAFVDNVVAHLAGAPTFAPAKAVLLAAHYDSVGAGPGAGDDGAGVAAVLESLRALRAGPPLPRPVVVWIDDGEEAGLLGAEAFTAQPERATIGAVVNLEARGTAGQSLMFETRKDNAWVIAALARAVPHPTMSSIFYTIYQYLPNDTDFSVFKRDGLQGANFAFVGEPTRYHTPLDDLAHLDAGTLQHHGENALAAVRAFAAANLETPPAGDAVYFDVLGSFVVRWPERWTVPLAGLGLGLMLLAIARRRRAGDVAWSGVGLGLLCWLGGLLLAAAAAFGVQQLLAACGALPWPWPAHPAAAVLAIWVTPFLVALAIAPRCGRRVGPPALWAGAWLGNAVVALLLAVTLPGVSFLLLVPALVAGALGATRFGDAARLLPAAVAAVLLFPVAWRLWDGMGAPLAAGIGTLVALVVLSLLGELAARGRLWLLATGALLVLAVTAAAVVPTASPARPAALNLVALDDRDGGGASVLVQGAPTLPKALAAAAAFRRPATPQFPWSRAPFLAAATTATDAPAPVGEVEAAQEVAGGRRVHLRLRSPRGASRLRLWLPGAAAARDLRVGGQALPPPTARDRAAVGGERTLTLLAVPAEGIAVEMTVTGAPVDAVLQDVTAGLPAAAQALRKACGSAWTPIGFGDATVVQRRLRF